MEFLKSLPKTFCSRRFYWDLVNRKTGIGLSYILFLFLMLCIPQVIDDYFVSRGIEAGMASIANSSLSMQIDKSGISINQPMPFFVKAYDGNTVIDTTYKVKDRYDLQHYMETNNITLFIMAAKIAVRNRMRHEITLLDLPKFEDNKPIIITHGQFIQLKQKINKWFIWEKAWVPLLDLAITLGFIISAALILMLRSLVTKRRLNFYQGMRLAAAS